MNPQKANIYNETVEHHSSKLNLYPPHPHFVNRHIHHLRPYRFFTTQSQDLRKQPKCHLPSTFKIIEATLFRNDAMYSLSLAEVNVLFSTREIKATISTALFRG